MGTKGQGSASPGGGYHYRPCSRDQATGVCCGPLNRDMVDSRYTPLLLSGFPCHCQQSGLGDVIPLPGPWGTYVKPRCTVGVPTYCWC